MGLDCIPETIRNRYHVEERRHAGAILSVDCKSELADILDSLDQFILLRSEIQEGGGGKSKIAARFDHFLAQREWTERTFKVPRPVDSLRHSK